jgi:putative MATE family efflux protein
MTDVFDITKDTLKPRKFLVERLIKLGLPSGITQGIFSLSMIVVQRLANSFGVSFIAANTVVMRVDGFAILPVFSFGQAITTYVGQNVGAGRMDRVRKGCREALKLAGGTTAVLVAIILLFGKYLMLAFTDTPEVIDMGTTFLRILAAGYIALAVTNILQGTMRGAGDTLTPMWLSIVQTVVIRVPLAYAMAALTVTEELPKGDYRIVPASLLIAWILGLLATIFFYKRDKWAKKAGFDKTN